MQHCFVGDVAADCRIGLFCDASFAADLTDSKSTTGALLCIFGPSTFVPITWVCKKHGAVSHSSTEAEVIALDAALRLEGLPALMLWDTVNEVFSQKNTDQDKTTLALGDQSRKSRGRKAQSEHHSARGDPSGRQPPQGSKVETSCLSDVARSLDSTKLCLNRDIDFVPPSAPLSSGMSKLFLFEDNEAVIKMCLKGRSPNLRHISRTHRVDLDWLIERIKVDPGIRMKFVGTSQQLADMLTKASFTIQKWNDMLRMHQIGDFYQKGLLCPKPVGKLRK